MKNIFGIRDILNKYDVFILDQWGVMHDGSKGYKQAISCVKKLYNLNKKIIIISNSSKRKESTLENLSILGFNTDHFLEVMTSGEMIWQSLVNQSHNFTKKLKKNCFHLYDKSDKKVKNYLQGLSRFNFVKNIEDANFLLGTSISQDFNTVDFVPILIKSLNKNLPFICANPDFETVNINKKLVICMGTVAELYKNLGGNVFILGKPSAEIYIESTKKIKKLNKSKILAVGDSLNHDIRGANLFGIDSLLITSGIHKSSFDTKQPKWNSSKNQFKNLRILPKFLCSKFKF